MSIHGAPKVHCHERAFLYFNATEMRFSTFQRFSTNCSFKSTAVMGSRRCISRVLCCYLVLHPHHTLRYKNYHTHTHTHPFPPPPHKAIMAISSVAGVMSLLKEDDPQLKASAVTCLLERVDAFWNEVSESLGSIEELQEDDAFPEREKAALLLAKVYYHLGEYKEALAFSLAAGKHFDVAKQDQFTTTIVRKCIDRYVALRQEDDSKDSQLPQLGALFTDLVGTWVKADDGKFAHITEHMGLCIAAQRFDLLEQIAMSYVKSTNSADVLTCILRFSNQHVDNVDVRETLLRCVVRMYSQGPEKLRAVNYFDMQQCLIFLNDSNEVCRNLFMLLESNNVNSDLIAYQLAFDLVDHCNQDFLLAVADGIQAHLAKAKEGDDKEAGDIPENYKNLCTIITGAPTTELQFQFLYSQNNGSIEAMGQLKKAVEYVPPLPSSTALRDMNNTWNYPKNCLYTVYR